jgi:hypothetical protein
MLPIGQHTEVESLTIVLLNLTMVLPLLETVLNSGKLKIHGEHLGEKVDSLDLLQETLAVFVPWPHIQTNDLSDKYIIDLLII